MRTASRLVLRLALLVSLAAPAAARAHCDTLDGPVVKTALAALASGRLEPVLAWVQPGDEAEVREAFERARAVRKGGKEARELADRWFLENLVRVHRAGEGAPYTGLKPAGTVEPAVAAADRAVETGDVKMLEAQLLDAVRHGLHAHQARLAAERPPAADVAAGRRWVAAYVPFVHWAEAVHRAAAGGQAHGEPHAAHAGPGGGPGCGCGHDAGPGAPAPHADAGADPHAHWDADAAPHAHAD